MRGSRAKVKPGCSLRERHDQAMANLSRYHKQPFQLKTLQAVRDDYWYCVYHWNDRKGVIIGKEPPNDTWPPHNR